MRPVEASRESAALSVPPRTVAPRFDARAALDWLDWRASRLEGAGALVFLAVSAVYAAVTVAFASRKLMWNDELYTFYMVVLPSMESLWAALLTGGEQTPPLFYAITRASAGLFGAGHVSLRLPEIVGFWVMSACVFAFVGRRTSWYPALCAAALPLVTTAYYYAFEARAYGLVLGFAAIALVCWQAAAERRAHALASVGLAVSLAAAVSMHYYAVFVVGALAIGELVRTAVTRRLDPAVWGAFAGPSIVLLLHLPLIRAGQRYSGAFWSPPQWIQVPEFYTDLLTPTILPIVATLVAAVIYFSLLDARRPGPPNLQQSRIPLHELAATCALAAIPFLAVTSAKLATGAFVNRYALPAVIGVAILAGYASALAFARHPLMRLATVLCFAGWFVLAQAREFVEPTGLSLPVSPVTVERAHAWLDAVPDRQLPFVVADPHTFAVLTHYGSPDVRARMVYLADPTLALRHLGHNSVERGMLDLLRPWFGMRVLEFEPFYARHREFLVYGDFVRLGFLNWMLPELRERGMHLELLNREGDNLFVRASSGRRLDAAALFSQPDASRERPVPPPDLR